jgi:hypothetical protein
VTWVSRAKRSVAVIEAAITQHMPGGEGGKTAAIEAVTALEAEGLLPLDDDSESAAYVGAVCRRPGCPRFKRPAFNGASREWICHPSHVESRDPIPRVGRTAGLLVEIMPSGTPGQVFMPVRDVGPEPLTIAERIRTLRSAALGLELAEQGPTGRCGPDPAGWEVTQTPGGLVVALQCRACGGVTTIGRPGRAVVLAEVLHEISVAEHLAQPRTQGPGLDMMKHMDKAIGEEFGGQDGS